MRCSRTTLQRNLARRCQFESLEDRCLLTSVVADMAWQPGGLTPSDWAERLTSGLAYRFPLKTPDIQRFSSEQEAIDALSQRVTDVWNPLFGQQLDRREFFRLEKSSIAMLDVLSASQSRDTRHFDVTNTQVAGVDEADIMEITADGYLFVVREGQLGIFDLRDFSDLVEVGAIDLPESPFEELGSFSPTQLHVSGNRLVIVSQGPRHLESLTDSTVVQIYDIADKQSPQLISSLHVEGRMKESRLVDGRLTLVNQGFMYSHSLATFQPRLILADGVSDEPVALGDEPLGRFETQEEYLSRVRPLLVGSFLPDFTQLDAQGHVIDSGDVGQWDDLVLRDSNFSRRQVTVLAIDIAAEAPAVVDSEVVVGSRTSFVYADTDSVYVVDRRGPVASDIYRFSFLSDNQEVVADAAGQVDGVIRDARMMDEFDGDLRVAANVWGGGLAGTSANLYVLRADGNSLRVIGQLENIAEGQSVTAAYFEGERAILTTAEDVLFRFDPIHGIDLSDPANPVELSDVVIPGVSNYLQWVGPTHLVGIGYTTEDTRHAQVSLYDVTDLTDPIVVDTWQSDWEISANLRGSGIDHRAVHYDADSGTLIVPFAELGIQSRSVGGPFSSVLERRGAEVFSIELGSGASLTRLAQVADGQHVLRSAVVDSTLVVLSTEALSTYELANPTNVLDTFYWDGQLPTVAPDAPAPAHSENVQPGALRLEASDGDGIETTSAFEAQPQDINGDGSVTALDALQVVNFINNTPRVGRAVGSGSGESLATTHLLDVNRDGLVSDIDVLSIVDEINARNDSRAEGEAPRPATGQVGESAETPLSTNDGTDRDDLLAMLAAEQISAWQKRLRL